MDRSLMFSRFPSGYKLIEAFSTGGFAPFLNILEDSDALYEIREDNPELYMKITGLILHYNNHPHDLTASLAATYGCEESIGVWFDQCGVAVHSGLICAGNGLILDANGIHKPDVISSHLEHVSGSIPRMTVISLVDVMQYADIDEHRIESVLNDFETLAVFVIENLEALTVRKPLEPTVMSLNEFLCDADGPDPWCNQHFDDYINDIDQQWDPDEVQELNNGYFLSPSSDSMLLLKTEGQNVEVVGYYNTPGAVCIKDEHQGKGLGAELILATFEWCGGPPTEGLDEQCFSEAGYEAHKAAYRLGLKRGIFVQPGRRHDFSHEP